MSPPSIKEAEQIAKATARRARRLEGPTAPLLGIDVNDSGKISIGSPHSDGQGFVVRLNETFGTASEDLVSKFIQQLANRSALSPQGAPAEINSALGFIAGVSPQTEVEAALACQMWASHCATMDLSARMAAATDVEQLQGYASTLAKMSRAFTAQTEALAKFRNAGKQTVEVVHVHKHVYVAPGGQAVVGDVHHHPGGGGGGGESYAQPHATSIGYSPSAEMPREDQERATMPILGRDRKETVSDARRSLRKRRAEGPR